MSADPGAYQTHLKFRTIVENKQHLGVLSRALVLYPACNRQRSKRKCLIWSNIIETLKIISAR